MRRVQGLTSVGWCPVSEPLDEPGCVVDLAEVQQRQAQLLDGAEGLYPEQAQFQRDCVAWTER